MSKKQIFIELVKVLAAFCVHYGLVLSPLMLIVSLIFMDDVIHNHPTLFKELVALTVFKFLEIWMEWHYAGKCEKDPKNLETYVKEYLEKTATYYFESEKLRKERLEWYIERWSKILRD